MRPYNLVQSNLQEQDAKSRQRKTKVIQPLRCSNTMYNANFDDVLRGSYSVVDTGVNNTDLDAVSKELEGLVNLLDTGEIVAIPIQNKNPDH